MKWTIDPGRKRRSINFIDNICYSRTADKTGAPLDLHLSLMVQNGNSEMRLAEGRDDEVAEGRQPLLLWINGAGWSGCDKNLMTAEMQFLAEAGYAVAFPYYRSRTQAPFPAQIIDCKTALRFLRANADAYGIDPKRVGVIGRSAGGHLAAWMAMNTDEFHSEEWAGQPDTVCAAVDLFGAVDIRTLNEMTLEDYKKPVPRRRPFADTPCAALVGGDPATVLERSDAASPIFSANEAMAPILILHGDQDPLVPLSMSEDFYDRIAAAGFEDRADLVIVKNGGHGTREFFQAETKQLILDFFDRHLRRE
ncbi:MAG: alpha/beta hydrolase [Lachnospiraceae bacterium]|nr:alpha/beta hydrolase [Lachnospiraceae bacterium]